MPNKKARASAGLVLAAVFALLQCRVRPAADTSAGSLRRSLFHLVQQAATTTNNGHVPASIAGQTRGLRILTLGGSVTWGYALRNKDHGTYSALLRRSHRDNVVHNLAIPSEGALYPAACVQSLLRSTRHMLGPKWVSTYLTSNNVDGGLWSSFFPPSLNFDDDDDDAAPPYDVIVLEYSINGVDGLPTLLRRLRNRYPDAIMIYVNLHSMKHLDPRRASRIPWLVRQMREVGGFVYNLPELPRGGRSVGGHRTWFADDDHHLNEEGHAHVANQVARLVERFIENAGPLPERPRNGTWGKGDRCYHWVKNGKAPPEVKFSRVAMLGDAIRPNRNGKMLSYAYEIPPGKIGTVSFEAAGRSGVKFGDDDVDPEPVYLVHMASHDPDLYPGAKLTINNEMGFDLETTDPKFGHIARASKVGYAKPDADGRITIRLKPNENDARKPLRVGGIVTCPACRELGMDVEQLFPRLVDYTAWDGAMFKP